MKCSLARCPTLGSLRAGRLTAPPSPHHVSGRGVLCTPVRAAATATATTTTATDNRASVGEWRGRPWHFSVELSTPFLSGPLALSTHTAGGALVACHTADQARWDAFVQDTVPSVAALRPEFVTLPCKEPYLASAPLVSTTQAAAHVLATEFDVPVMLTLNATIDPRRGLSVSTNHASDKEDEDEDGRDQRRVDFMDATAEAVTDFYQHRGGRHVLVVRGDDYSRGVSGPGRQSTSGVGQRALTDSATLLRHVRRVQSQSRPPSRPSIGAGEEGADGLAVAGYPQGHITQRLWMPTTTDPAETEAAAEALSMAFLTEWEASYRAVSSSCSSPTTTSQCTENDGPRSLLHAHLLARLVALDQRLRHAQLVLRLVQTPSVYPPSRRHRNIVDELVRDKLQPCLTSATRSPRVVVMTQATFSADEFLSYARDLRLALLSAAASGTATGLERAAAEAVTVAAGVLVPPYHDAALALSSFLSVVMRVKVVPCEALVDAVHVYADALSASLGQTREAFAAEGGGLSEAKAQQLVDGLNTDVRHLDKAFAAVWWRETVALVGALLMEKDTDVAGPDSSPSSSSSSMRAVHIHFMPLGPGSAAGVNTARLMEAVRAQVH